MGLRKEVVGAVVSGGEAKGGHERCEGPVRVASLEEVFAVERLGESGKAGGVRGRRRFGETRARADSVALGGEAAGKAPDALNALDLVAMVFDEGLTPSGRS